MTRIIQLTMVQSQVNFLCTENNKTCDALIIGMSEGLWLI